MTGRPYRTIAELPTQFPVFPLSGAMLFPRWQLPLNIFEPRYLNMIDDAMAGHRVIGMVQTTGGPKHAPDLAQVGCLGKIMSYSETDDGRYLISLTGLSRFDVGEELETDTPYRQVHAAFDRYKDDMIEPKEGALPGRELLIAALKSYAERKNMTTDWSAVDTAPIETLVNALCAGCPFSIMEKQALLEAEGLTGRYDTLIALMQMGSGDEDIDKGRLQ